MRLFLKENRGSAVVEVAILIPVILMLTYGFIFFNLAVKEKIVLQTAAREAAREWAKSQSQTRAIDKAKEEAAIGGLDPEKLIVRTKIDGSRRFVATGYDRGIKVPFIEDRFEMRMKGEAVFHVESQTVYR